MTNPAMSDTEYYDFIREAIKSHYCQFDEDTKRHRIGREKCGRILEEIDRRKKAMTWWRRIETCPDDGRPVWIWNAASGLSPQIANAAGNLWNTWAMSTGPCIYPTHWMPADIPAPPISGMENGP